MICAATVSTAPARVNGACTCRRCLHVSTVPARVDGACTPSVEVGGIDVVNPATTALIDRIPAGHEADVDTAVQAPRTAFARHSSTRARPAAGVTGGLEPPVQTDFPMIALTSP